MIRLTEIKKLKMSNQWYLPEAIQATIVFLHDLKKTAYIFSDPKLIHPFYVIEAVSSAIFREAISEGFIHSIQLFYIPSASFAYTF